MIIRDNTAWQLILADLALILFLVAIAGLADASEEEARRETEKDRPGRTSIAPAQALYRPDPDGPTITEWLEDQTIDNRATLSVVATHTAGQAHTAWTGAEALAEQARTSNVAIRVVVIPADSDDLYASLAYDAVQP